MRLATRILTLTIAGGLVDMPVHLDAPEAGPDGGWFYTYEIGWPDEPRRHAGWGIDAIQVLHIMLEMIGAALYLSDEHAEGRLMWEKQGSGYGFPVPNTMRGQLTGGRRAVLVSSRAY